MANNTEYIGNITFILPSSFPDVDCCSTATFDCPVDGGIPRIQWRVITAALKLSCVAYCIKMSNRTGGGGIFNETAGDWNGALSYLSNGDADMTLPNFIPSEQRMQSFNCFPVIIGYYQSGFVFGNQAITGRQTLDWWHVFPVPVWLVLVTIIYIWFLGPPSWFRGPLLIFLVLTVLWHEIYLSNFLLAEFMRKRHVPFTDWLAAARAIKAGRFQFVLGSYDVYFWNQVRHSDKSPYRELREASVHNPILDAASAAEARSLVNSTYPRFIYTDNLEDPFLERRFFTGVPVKGDELKSHACSLVRRDLATGLQSRIAENLMHVIASGHILLPDQDGFGEKKPIPVDYGMGEQERLPMVLTNYVEALVALAVGCFVSGCYLAIEILGYTILALLRN